MSLTRIATYAGWSAARLGLAAVLLAGAGLSAQAQNANQGAPAQQAQTAPGGEAPQPDWIKLCSTNPENNQQVCVVTRERRAGTGQLLAAFSVRQVGDKKIMVTAVPPGMLLRPGLQVTIDGAKAQKATYTICFPNLCFAEADVNNDYVASLKRGNQLVITTLSQQAKPVNFDISLRGFTAAYDGPAIDPAQLQAEEQRLQDELRRKAEAARQQLIERQQGATPAAQGAAPAAQGAAPAAQ